MRFRRFRSEKYQKKKQKGNLGCFIIYKEESKEQGLGTHYCYHTHTHYFLHTLPTRPVVIN